MNALEQGQKIAITVWGQRVSPVFDSARTLLLVEDNGQGLAATSRIGFDPERPLELLHLLRAQRVVLIICGAVSEGPAAMIEAAGIEMIPFITGNVQQVLEHFLAGHTFDSTFCMPGCGKNICCRGRIRRGHGLQSAHFQHHGTNGPVSATAPQRRDHEDPASAASWNLDTKKN
nr:NifB/NifX family molybdenum-iron cluster-binding protein [uncultured Desulfobulbus sp.]